MDSHEYIDRDEHKVKYHWAGSRPKKGDILIAMDDWMGSPILNKGDKYRVLSIDINTRTVNVRNVKDVKEKESIYGWDLEQFKSSFNEVCEGCKSNCAGVTGKCALWEKGE